MKFAECIDFDDLRGYKSDTRSGRFSSRTQFRNLGIAFADARSILSSFPDAPWECTTVCATLLASAAVLASGGVRNRETSRNAHGSLGQAIGYT